jgi:hypothetical protein
MDGTTQESETLNQSQIYINLISIIVKKLAKANLLNCWEVQNGQSAAKLRKEKVQRLVE